MENTDFMENTVSFLKPRFSVKKAFVDPDDQEVGALDKFLMDNTTCLPKENFTLLQKIGNGAYCIFYFYYLIENERNSH